MFLCTQRVHILDQLSQLVRKEENKNEKRESEKNKREKNKRKMKKRQNRKEVREKREEKKRTEEKMNTIEEKKKGEGLGRRTVGSEKVRVKQGRR